MIIMTSQLEFGFVDVYLREMASIARSDLTFVVSSFEKGFLLDQCQVNTHAHEPTSTHKHTQTHANTQTNTYTHEHTNTHKHTQTHTQTLTNTHKHAF